jgi:ABC-2 type transport system permease protein
MSLSPSPSQDVAAIGPSPGAGPAALPARLPRAFPLSAWLTLLAISVEQFVRGRRLLALAALFALPTVLALVVRYYNPQAATPRGRADAEQVVVFYMLPQALVPLAALILASGMIRDEVENQTLTYLLIRPLPRPSIYLAKLLAAWLVAAALAAVFDTTALAAVHWGADDFWGRVIPAHAARVAALSALSLTVYVALFGALGLVVRWILPLGVAYIVVFEGVFANVDFAVRRLTVLWYVRILAERWFGLHVETWLIDLDEVPSGREALFTLLAAAAVLAAAAAWLFGLREIRVKTPEGS